MCKPCTVFFDSGSNTNLVCHAYAQQLGLPGTPVTQHLQVTGKQPEQWDTFPYRVPLCTTNGKIEHILAFRIADITADLPPVNLAPIAPLLGGVQLKDIQQPTGAVDLLLGIHEARSFPNHVLHSHNNLLLCQSSFGSVLLLIGH